MRARRAADAGYRERERVRAAAQHAARRDDPEFRASQNAKTQAWRAAHPDQHRANARRWARDVGTPRNRKRRQSDPVAAAKHADACATRRARKRGAFVERVYRSIVWRRDGGICGICGEAADPANWHLDHVVPLALGGEHSYANTQVAHPSCNCSKGAREGV